MSPEQEMDFFRQVYQDFDLPLSEQDCGLKCGPHNDYGVPVCCDIKLVVPSAYEGEWHYLQQNTDLWQPWSSSGLAGEELDEGVQDGQVLLQCQGYQACQRPFRTLTCRAFPFYPYLSGAGAFLGLAYYEDFRPYCWIISNLSVVSLSYKKAFGKAFEDVFRQFPASKRDYQAFSSYAREQAARKGEAILVLDFDGGAGWIDPVTEDLRPANIGELPAYGPYLVTRELAFPDEIQSEQDGSR